jgi:hypothetical protein
MVPEQGKDEDGRARPGQSLEGEKQRVDRELIELLNELRVALPGVQVLFAFLLIVPFSNGYSRLTGLQRGVYFGSFLATAASSALLIAPSAYHRLHFRSKDKERMLLTSNRLAIAGVAFLAAAIGLTTFLVTDILFAVPAAAGVTAATTAWFGWFWYGLPLARRHGDPAK